MAEAIGVLLRHPHLGQAPRGLEIRAAGLPEQRQHLEHPGQAGQRGRVLRRHREQRRRLLVPPLDQRDRAEDPAARGRLAERLGDPSSQRRVPSLQGQPTERHQHRGLTAERVEPGREGRIELADPAAGGLGVLQGRGEDLGPERAGDGGEPVRIEGGGERAEDHLGDDLRGLGGGAIEQRGGLRSRLSERGVQRGRQRGQRQRGVERMCDAHRGQRGEPARGRREAEHGVASVRRSGPGLPITRQEIALLQLVEDRAERAAAHGAGRALADVGAVEQIGERGDAKPLVEREDREDIALSRGDRRDGLAKPLQGGGAHLRVVARRAALVISPPSRAAS